MIDCFMPGLRDLGAIIVAPDALGGDWTTAKNEQAVVWITKSLIKTFAIDEAEVMVAGFSMGGEGTWHIASRHQDLFTGAIPVAAPVPPGTNVEWKIPVYVVHSEADDIVPYKPAKTHAKKLEDAGYSINWAGVVGLTHYDAGEYGAYLRDGIAWIRTHR